MHMLLFMDLGHGTYETFLKNIVFLYPTHLSIIQDLDEVDFCNLDFMYRRLFSIPAIYPDTLDMVYIECRRTWKSRGMFDE